jgi:hypothetical protein
MARSGTPKCEGVAQAVKKSGINNRESHLVFISLYLLE